MTSGPTYTPIATTTLASTTGSYTFSSIPSTYTDLVIITNGLATGTGQMSLQFNGATTNYSSTSLNGNGTSAFSQRTTSASNTYMQLGYYDYFETTARATAITQIMNYANSTSYKSVISRMNNTATGVGASVGLWSNTAAITSITVLPSTSSWAAGTTFTLYGIASA